MLLDEPHSAPAAVVRLEAPCLVPRLFGAKRENLLQLRHLLMDCWAETSVAAAVVFDATAAAVSAVASAAAASAVVPDVAAAAAVLVHSVSVLRSQFKI